MSNNYWEDEDEDQDNDINLQGDDLVKKLRKAKRADEKRIKELTEQLEGLSKVQRERTVKEVLEKKGVNLKAARLVLKDLDDVSEESVSNWLDDNADLFGINVPTQSNADNVDLAALRQQDIVTQGAYTPDRETDFNNKIDNAQSAEELIALIQSQKQ
jgi:DNA-binding transcriptional regulator YbjK